MTFSDVFPRLEAKPGIAQAARRSWKNRAYVVAGFTGRLYIFAGGRNLPYALSFDDATAEDWILT